MEGGMKGMWRWTKGEQVNGIICNSVNSKKIKFKNIEKDMQENIKK